MGVMLSGNEEMLSLVQLTTRGGADITMCGGASICCWTCFLDVPEGACGQVGRESSIQ